MSMENIDQWTKIPFKINIEYGAIWIFGIPFYLFVIYKTFKSYLTTNNIYLLFISITVSIFLLMMFYRRFFKTTALLLSEEGITVFPIIKKPYFVPWNHIDKFIFSATYVNLSPIRIKSVSFYYKKEYEKRTFFTKRKLPIFAYHYANFKRLKELHNKYKNL